MTTETDGYQFPPIIVNLRGVTPQEVVAVATVLLDAGIHAVEVPLNTKDALASIGCIAAVMGDEMLCGGGNVFDPADVDRIRAVGGRLVMSPVADAEVIGRALALGMFPIPGFMTPAEAMGAIRAGATTLALFPAAGPGTAHLRALQPALPRDIGIIAIGGIDSSTIGRWQKAGAIGVGAGASVYRPGRPIDEVGARARELRLLWESPDRFSESHKAAEAAAPVAENSSRWKVFSRK